MTKVLYVIEQRDYSGAEWMHLPLLRDDPDALLACPGGSRTEAWARERGVATADLPHRTMRHSAGPLEALRSIPRGLRAAHDLRRLLRRHPDRQVVYCVALRSGLLGALAALGMRRRVVWFVSDRLPPQAPLAAAVRAVALVGCHRALATSRYVLEDFARGSRRLRARSTVVYPGTDLERFRPPAAPRAPGGPAVVLGHVSPTKRTDLAIEIAARVAARRPGFRLEVLGRAQYREEDFALERALRRRVAEDPVLRRTVTFRGRTDDVPAELHRAGLLLHTRDDEPFGIALTEAMACGLPVVAPASAGPAEIVTDGETGLTYPPGDADAAAEQVVRLLDDPGLAERLGAAGRTKVAHAYSVSGQLEAMRKVLRTETRKF